MNDQLKQILEQQLRDAQAPDAISWWPLAYGWWGVIFITVALLCFAYVKLRMYRQRNAHRKAAVADVDRLFLIWQTEQNDTAYLQAANEVVKRTCLHFSQSANRLSGHSWIQFLNAHSQTPLSESTATALAYQLYQHGSKANIAAIHPQIVDWLLKHSNVSNAQINHMAEREHA